MRTSVRRPRDAARRHARTPRLRGLARDAVSAVVLAAFAGLTSAAHAAPGKHGREPAPTFLARAVTVVRHGIAYVASHTGVPIVLVAAIVLVVSYRAFRASARFVVQVAIVAAVLLIAHGLGLVTW